MPVIVNTSLKQRLIGAIVLIALAVIFLPMLIYSPEPDHEINDVPLAVPRQPPANELETRVLHLAAPPVTGLPVTVADNATPPPTVEAEVTPPAPSSPHAAAPAVVTTPEPIIAAGNYAVSFGAYASPADAQVVITHLQTFNLRGFQQKDILNGRDVWRVRIGPYTDRAQAELARLEAGKVRSDVNAQVVVLDTLTPQSVATAPTSTPKPLTPTRPATPPVVTTPPPRPAVATDPPVTLPATPSAPSTPTTPVATVAPPASSVRLSQTGYAVQVGAFSQAAQANTLRDRIRIAGFSAFVEAARNDNGPIHRVRVGPVANRTDAEQLKAQMALIGVADSTIVPVP